MKTVEASLSIELNVECPHCENYFDLFDYDDGRLNEEGNLIMVSCPDGSWSEEHDRFHEKIECPDCNKEIQVKGIAW